jgi:predicted transcriptional regulator of viral defense system
MFSEYLKKVRAKGRIYFTLEEALKDLGVTKASVYSAVSRYKKRGELISPAKGLYVIIPPEYKNLGCLPAEELVPILMAYYKVTYYAGLLTAASYYGASHQKPGAFQVVLSKRFRENLHFGRVRIDFIYKKILSNLPIKTITVTTGYLSISSPEVTAMDLFLYPHESGGINHSATVLSELVEALDPSELIALAKSSRQHAWVQRLGYVLENIDSLVPEHQQIIVDALARYLASEDYRFISLESGLPTKGCSRSSKWKIIENTTIESDL